MTNGITRGMLSMSQAGKLVGISARAMRRRLLDQEEMLGVRFVHRTKGKSARGTRHTITVALLRRYFPEWFSSSDDLPDVIRDVISRTEKARRESVVRDNALGASFRDLRARVTALEAALCPEKSGM